MARLAADEVRLAGGGPYAVGIWPTANRLPANILRFYVQFSEPAEAVFDRAQLRLITATSALVPDAFLMLNEGLGWPRPAPDRSHGAGAHQAGHGFRPDARAGARSGPVLPS